MRVSYHYNILLICYYVISHTLKCIPCVVFVIYYNYATLSGQQLKLKQHKHI